MTVGADIEAEKHAQNAAVLQCGSITWEHLETGVGELKAWGKENAKYILEKEILTREYGFFVVTGTRKTTWCKLKCWSATSHAVASTLSAGVTSSDPQIGLSANFQGNNDQEGWIVRPANDTNVRPEYGASA